MTRIERREAVTPKPADVAKLADLYGVSPQEREELLTLARQTRAKGWWTDYADAFRGPLPDLEIEATLIMTWTPPFIPGLLQTADYARAVFTSYGYPGPEVERRVAARMRRQEILNRDRPPRLHAVLDECVTRKVVGSPQIMAAQLRHLTEMADRTHMSIRMVLDEAGVYGGTSGPFTVLEFPADPAVVYLETATASTVQELPGVVERHVEIHEGLQDLALSEDDTAGFLSAAAGAFAAR